MARWRDELAGAGWPVFQLLGHVERTGAGYRPPEVDLDQLVGELLAPGGRLASEKTFSRADVIVAAARHLHGQAVSVLDEAVEKVLAHPDAIMLPAVAGAKEQVWAAACVLADEEKVAELADKLVDSCGPRVDHADAAAAVATVEARLGHRLTVSQTDVAVGLLTSGRGLDLVVGIAGSGKTTTVSAVKEGFEAAGYSVIGTATSGQAAKTLGEGAGIESRTVASLWWRLQHGQLALSARHVVILDESGMTTDADIARLLGAVERAGAKLVAVGDDRQLSPVGPGGALTALVERHPDIVYRLVDNLRQVDADERDALGELRSGSVEAALAWYVRHGRLHHGDSRRVYRQIGQAWQSDVTAGRDVILLAYKRADVERLNLAARHRWEALAGCQAPNWSSTLATATAPAIGSSSPSPAPTEPASPPSGPRSPPLIPPTGTSSPRPPTGRHFTWGRPTSARTNWHGATP